MNPLNIFALYLESSYSFLLLANDKEDAIRQYNLILGDSVDNVEAELFRVKMIKDGSICSLGTFNPLSGEVLGNLCKIIDLKEVIKDGSSIS